MLMKSIKWIKSSIKILALFCAIKVGLPTPLRTLDRSFLEKKVFKYLNTLPNNQKSKLLFIGVEYYTRHYYSKLNFDVTTIDIDPDKKKYGNRHKHIVGSATEINSFFPKNYFNVIVANGLLGYGMNGKLEFDKMLSQCHETLVKNGILVLGYNQTPRHLNFDLTDCMNYKLFTDFIPDIDSVKTSNIMVNSKNNHTFIFLKKN